MKHTVFALALISAFANATPSNPCNLASPPPPVLYTDFFTGSPTVDYCAPYPMKGILDTTSTLPTFASNDKGMTVYWYCKHPVSGKWNFNFAAATKAELSKANYLQNLSAGVAAATAASNPTAALNALGKANINTPLNDPTLAEVWCPVWPSIWFSKPADPVPANLVVAPTTYLFRNNALSPLQSKATVGAACNCAVPRIVDTKKYCTFAGAVSPTILAECS